ncbi:SDR family oxidoreductase [Vibrio sp. Of7-15]|uniref:SDR family oxidoreductase n=1 Tax=Vibrio sp. Of7-15 TaxID=2724879 RepID=UPI001EF3719A|nr:SDR family oxidoreductase [Vibrio sp. Of7-15]MCG7495752.1 SDR family oxidoreductase [Vibrio sp. Of7-15]
MTRSILITGCSSGIGYECAHALHKQGFQVIASCRKVADVERLQQEGLTCLQLDLQSPESITQAVQKTLELTNGQLYALFNNGAYGQPGALEDLPRQALREQFEVNLFGWHQLVAEVLPIMRQAGEGRIIQNSSVLGIVAMKYRGAYNASKFALEGWTDTLRLELQGSGIQISLIEPGPIETQFRANALNAFTKWVNIDNSEHRLKYQQQIARLEKKESNNAFTLPASSIVPPLLHALMAKRAKPRYRVTTPTKVFAFLRRILPTKQLDYLLSKSD